MYDIDNRSAQETGYLFEPIMAAAVGGASATAGNSPVKRSNGCGGRQVDCIKGGLAYEIKLRVTSAASGQGRWKEELSFPEDARKSGLTPVLIVFDPTPSDKLNELSQRFLKEGGTAYVGDHAWEHLREEAGDTVARFLEAYVRTPLAQLLEEAPEELPDIELSMRADVVVFRIGGTEYRRSRHNEPH